MRPMTEIPERFWRLEPRECDMKGCNHTAGYICPLQGVRAICEQCFRASHCVASVAKRKSTRAPTVTSQTVIQVKDETGTV